MSNTTKQSGNIGVRGKRRLVSKTRWELPYRGSKSYWDKICNDIESKVSMTVRNPSSSTTISHPIIFPPSILYSAASSASRDDFKTYNFSKRHLATEVAEDIVCESIVNVPASSTFSRDSSIATKISPDTVTFSPELVDYSNETPDSSKSQFSLTKLLKITKLVNDFLSSTRIRVRPRSSKSKKFSSPTKRSSERDRNRKLALTSEKSVDPRSNDHLSENGSLIGKRTSEESKEKTANCEDAVLKRRSVGFRDDFEETMEKDFYEKDDNVDITKPRRARAPSLSIASAVPSFGKFVISIEDIDSPENEEEYDEPLNSRDNVISKDYRRTIESDEPEVNERKPTHDFLKVPEIRLAGSASYPTRDWSKCRQQNGPSEMQLGKEAFQSKLLKESRIFQKNYHFWSKRSFAHVFRALTTMKNGLRSKARIESENNKFFAAPLEIYSPSARSSMSSESRTDFTDGNVGESASEKNDGEIMNEEDNDRCGTREKIDSESNSSSYASIRVRLMRNAVAHLSKDTQGDAADTCIDTDNAPEATYERAIPSSFHNSWSTRKNEIVVSRRNKKTLERRFIGIPRLGRIFPRIKADKCFACMCQSLGDIDQARQRKTAGTLLNDEIVNDLHLDDNARSSDNLAFDFSTGNSFEQFYRNRQRVPLSTDKWVAKSSVIDHLTGPLISESRDDEDLATDVKDSRSSIQKSVVSSLRNSSQIDDPHQSRKIVKSPSKSLISAKSLISSLSLVSERSRSISDQDDSDQGCTDPKENDVGLGEGSNSKYLAPCHMPINLNPSLEPLKALRNKQSRSIRSRVASAEKSVDSANDDDDDSDYEANIVKQPLKVTKKRLEAGGSVTTLGTFNSPRGEQKIVMTKDRDVSSDDVMESDRIQSIVESNATISSKVGADNTVKNDVSDNLPIISNHEVMEISANCLASNMTITEVLRILTNEYSKRLSERLSHDNRLSRSTNARKNDKLAINLLALLVDSKYYLNREKQPNDIPDLSFSSKQPNLCNSRQLRRILPLKSYNLVAPILGMPKWYPLRETGSLRDVAKRASRMMQQEKSRGGGTFDLIVHPPSRLERNVSFEKISKDSSPKLNPYSLFLMKPRRKAVTWRPLTERDLEGYDPQATLKMRAAKITDRICEDFCRWLESLAAGTNQTSGIDVEVLKDMFETDFTAEVCSTMQVSFKEMPMVPTAVAIARNCPGAGELALTRRHLVKDARAEMRAKRTIGFGTSLPKRLKFIPPRNRVDEKWLQCENVPKDLETMEAVWKDIMHLTSVKGFIKWLIAHPEVKRPKALENMLPSRETMGTRESIVDRFKHLELDLDQIQSLKVGDNAPDAY